MPIIEFDYMNHKGQVRARKIEVEALEFFMTPIWGYQPGWFISGLDMEKMERRSFSLNRIIFPEEEAKQRMPVRFPLGGL